MKTVLITGASGGIGGAAVAQFHAAGWNVFATDRAGSGENRERLTWLAMDVTKEDSVRAAAAQVRGLDLLVNNAGIGRLGPTLEVDEDEFRAQLEVNVLGLWRTARAFAPQLIQRGGRLINVSSLAGVGVFPFFGPYCASKHAVEGLSAAMRMELGALGVKVSVVEPGIVGTGFVDAALSSMAVYAARGSPFEAALRRGEELRKLLSFAELKPAQVAATILRAAHARWPRAHYPVGRLATFGVALLRWLPARFGDVLLRRAFGLPSGAVNDRTVGAHEVEVRAR